MSRHSPPLTRADCQYLRRPCTRFRCKFNLIGEANPRGACYNTTNCALDEADQGPLSVSHIARVLGWSRSQVQSVLSSGIEKVKNAIED